MFKDMNELKITTSDLKIITEDLSKKIVFSHISNITIINSTDLFMAFSMYRKEKLLVSLNPQHPFVSLVNIDNPCPTKMGGLSDTLRKEVKDGFVTAVEMVNNDRVIKISYHHTNDYFDRENRKIIIELIPHRPNLILLNDDDVIVYATHYTDINNEHPIIKGLMYKELENPNQPVEEDFDLDNFKESASDYYEQAKRKRLEEQYKPLLKHIKSRIKTLSNKNKILEREIADAKEMLAYQDIGTMILTYANDEEALREYVQENNIDYNFSFNPGYNSGKYFTKYKKAKRTIEIDKKEIDKTIDEIDYLQTCLAQSKYMDEENIIELGALLFPNKFKINSKKKIDAKPGQVIVNGTKIMFGRNAKQNEELTFKKANRDDMFLHIKDNHGSHVIVCSPNPDNEIMLVASELALLLSGKEDGEVQYTKVRNVKKGSFVGQAILTSYQSYYLRTIRPKTKKLLKI